MTAFDRFDPFERRITEAIDEIAAARPTAYLNDILQQTARVSQRRGLRAFLIGAQPWPATPGLGVRRLPPGLRIAIAFAGVAALVVAGTWAGSRLLERTRTVLLAPYGPAANGLVAFSVGSDLFLGDPTTGSSRLFAADVGSSGVFDRSGTRIATVRLASMNPPGSATCYGAPPVPECTLDIVVTSIGGQSVVVTREPLQWPAGILDWSADGRSILVGGPSGLRLVAADGSGTRPLSVFSTNVMPRFSPSDTSSIWTDERAGGGLRPVRMGLDGQVLTRFNDLGGRTNLAFAASPDGQRVAISGDGSDVLIARIDGTVERSIDLGPDVDQIVSLNWSPDGRAIVVEALRGATHASTVVDPQGIAPARALDPRASSSCTWAPDGTALLCTDQDAGWWIADLAGGARRMAWPGTQMSYQPSWQRVAVEERP